MNLTIPFGDSSVRSLRGGEEVMEQNEAKTGQKMELYFFWLERWQVFWGVGEWVVNGVVGEGRKVGI